MSIIQFILVIAIAAAGFGTFRQFRQGRLSLAWLLIWLLLWTGSAIVVLLPWTTTLVANLVGVGRGSDFIIYLSIVGLAYLVFRLFVKIEDVEREITRLVRTLALEKAGRQEGVEGSEEKTLPR